MVHLNLFMPEIDKDLRNKLVTEITDTLGKVMNLTGEARESLSIFLDTYKKSDLAVNGHFLNGGKGRKAVHVIEVHGTIMPHELKKRMAADLTNTYCKVLGLDKDARHVVRVTFMEHSAHNIALGGVMLDEMHLARK